MEIKLNENEIKLVNIPNARNYTFRRMPPVDLNVPVDIENKSSQEYEDWVGDLRRAGRVDYGDPEEREKNYLMEFVVDNFKNQG